MKDPIRRAIVVEVASFPRELMGAFRPGSAIDEPARFSGRQDQILDLTKSLLVDGSCPMIIGDRGLGKSSLAEQVRLISMGDTFLLGRYSLDGWAIPVDESFIGLTINCTDSVKDTNGILQRLVGGISSLTADVVRRKGEFHLVERTSKVAVSLKVFTYERGKRWLPDTWDDKSLRTSRDYEQALIDATTRLSEIFESPVLLIIDELDRVRDKSGLASYVKTATAVNLKFMLVGIAQNVSTLLDDHRSIERSLMPVHVPVMTRREMSGIVERAVSRLQQRGLSFAFAPEVVDALGEMASGFPWFVHALGQESLLHAFSARSRVVEPKHLAVAVTTLTKNRFSQQFSDAYQQAVKDSYNREIVVRLFAKWTPRDIPTNEIYAVAKSLGVSNPSTYRQQLCSGSTGHVLASLPFQTRGLVRFSNEMFKIYIRLRTSLYEGLDEKVDSAWASYIEDRGLG